MMGHLPIVVLTVSLGLALHPAAVRAEGAAREESPGGAPDPLRDRTRDHRQALDKLEARLASHPGDEAALVSSCSESVRWSDESGLDEAMKRAARCLDRARAALPENPEVIGWGGILMLIHAKYGGGGGTARSQAQQGLALLDDAVDRDRGHLTLLLMRASASIQVPREWNRLPQAQDDLLRIDHAVRHAPGKVKEFGLDLDEVYFKLGQTYWAQRQRDPARAAWARAKAAGSGPFALRAAKALDRTSSRLDR